MPEAAVFLTSPEEAGAWHGRRLGVLIVVIGLATGVLLARPVHAWLLSLFEAAELLIRQRPAWGMVAFVGLAAVSAMLAFVSSAFLVPVAVYVWGPERCVLLLWLGWYLGGVATYLIGRYLGRPAVEALLPARVLARYDVWARSGPSLSLVLALLLQLSAPSDVAGYLFGLVRCRPSVFLPALALAEVPYAIGAVYLGQSFLEGRLPRLVGIGLLGAALSYAARRFLRQRIAAEVSPSDGPPEPDATA